MKKYMNEYKVYRAAVGVEPDTLDKDKYMVVVRDMLTHELIGIPYRGASERDARRMCPYLMYAFNYGAKWARKALSRVDLTVTEAEVRE